MFADFFDRSYRYAVRRRFGGSAIIAVLEDVDTGDVQRLKNRGRVAWYASVPLNYPFAARWNEERKLEWPPVCCGCGRSEVAPQSVLHYRRKIGRFKRFFMRPETIANVPHCSECAQAGGRLIVDSGQIGPTWATAVVGVLAGCADFLQSFIATNAMEDICPPWLAFPEFERRTGLWAQGNGEYWYRCVWNPFWDRLDAIGQREYLLRWPPPEIRDTYFHMPSEMTE
jgi:hypothetical protein